MVGHQWIPRLGEQQEAPILKIYSAPTYLEWYVHLVANFVSFPMSLTVVMNCGTRNVLYGFEISMFYLFNLKKHHSCGPKMLSNHVNNLFFLENFSFKDYEIVKLV